MQMAHGAPKEMKEKRANGSVIRDKRATLPRLRIEATLQAPDRKRYGAVAPVEVYGLRLILKTKRLRLKR